MVGIEKRIRQDYGDDYWEGHKQTILDRTHAPSYPKKYNSEVRRKMERHPEKFRPEELREAGFSDLAAEIERRRTLRESKATFDPDREQEEEEGGEEEDDDEDSEDDEEDTDEGDDDEDE